MADLAKDRHALSPLFQQGKDLLKPLSLIAQVKETEELLEIVSFYDSAIACDDYQMALALAGCSREVIEEAMTVLQALIQNNGLLTLESINSAKAD